MSERQELLAALMESKKRTGTSARSKEALELLEQKHRLETLKKERERARFLEEKELPVMEGAVTATAGSSFRSFSPSVAPGTNEEMWTP